LCFVLVLFEVCRRDSRGLGRLEENYRG
jgi:hypothetical protein